jgi:hypothetical protein
VAPGTFALIALVAFGQIAGETAASPTPIRVSLEAPPDCATAESFYQGVRDRTDRVRTPEPDDAPIELSVRLVRSATKVQGELRMSGEHGESDTRRVEGATCEEVVEALSLTAALAIDPRARLVAEPPPPAPPPPPPEKPSRPPIADVPTTDPSAPPRQRFSEFSLSAQALATQIVSPDVFFGGAIAGRLAFDPDAGGESVSVAVLHVRNDLFQTPNDARYRLTAFSITGCPVRLRLSGATTLEPCATTIAGWLSAEALHVETSTSKIRTYWSVGGVAVIRVAAGPGAALEVFGGAMTPLTMRHFNVGVPAESLGETPVISPLAGLGVSWAF